jgi:hypothetical protein
MRVRLGAWLLNKGKVSEDQLQRALQHQKFFGGRIGSSFIKLGYIDEDTLGDFLADVSGVPYASPARLESVAPEVLALVPARLAAQYRVIPIAIEGRRLRLAMRDPKDLIALDEIAFLTGMTIEPSVATEFRIQKALQRYYQVATGGPTIPVTMPTSAVRPEIAAGTPPADGRGEVGLDGYPMDADADQIGNALAARSPGVPLAAGETDDPVPPTSLQQWRMAQKEIPEEFPDPPAPQARSGRPGAAAAALAEPEAPPPQPGLAAEMTLDECARRLQKAETRDEVFAAVLGFVAARFKRTALFVVHADKVAGWGGCGPGVDPVRVRQVVAPLDRPSLFTPLRSGADHYFGRVNDQPVNTRFYLDLGFPAPEQALLMPLRIKERPTVVLYADNAADPSAPPDIPLLQRLLAKAALALEILILRNKILAL